MLNYALNLDTEYRVDFVFIEHSSDGVTWTNAFGPSIGLSGSTGGWLLSGAFGGNANLGDLNGLATAQVRFRFETDLSITLDGVHVDDVAITVPNTTIGAHSVNDYVFLNGTSMATPHVAGVAALVWSADPGLTSLQLKTRLMNNGDPIAALVGKTVSGKRLNAQMAMPLHAATALTAAVVSFSQVDLSWVDNSVSETSYLVQRDSCAGFTTIATLAADSSAYSDAAAPAGTNLVYQIVAQARDGRATASATTNAMKPAAPVVVAGGGGCMLNPQTGFDPMLPTLLLIAFSILYLRRRKA